MATRRWNAIRRTGPAAESIGEYWLARKDSTRAAVCASRAAMARGGKQPGFATQEMAKLPFQ